MRDPLSNLQPALLAKIGSIVGHVQEFRSPHGHPADLAAIDALLLDPEVRDWLESMRKLAMIPQPRAPL